MKILWKCKGTELLSVCGRKFTCVVSFSSLSVFNYFSLHNSILDFDKNSSSDQALNCFLWSLRLRRTDGELNLICDKAKKLITYQQLPIKISIQNHVWNGHNVNLVTCMNNVTYILYEHCNKRFVAPTLLISVSGYIIFLNYYRCRYVSVVSDD